MEFLLDVLIKREKEISVTSLSLLKRHRDKLKKEYAEILDYIHSNVQYGEILKLEEYIKENINGSFSKIIDDFVDEYQIKKVN